MTNYEAMMKEMSPEALAEKNVHLVTVDNRRLFYMTSSGQLFNNTDYEAAVHHEYQWLMYDPTKENCDAESCDAAELETESE